MHRPTTPKKPPPLTKPALAPAGPPPTRKHTKTRAARTIHPQSSLPFVGQLEPRTSPRWFFGCRRGWAPCTCGPRLGCGGGVLAALAGFPESSKMPPRPAPVLSGRPRLRFPTLPGHAATAETEATRQQREPLPGGSVGKHSNWGRKESSRRELPAGAGRGRRRRREGSASLAAASLTCAGTTGPAPAHPAGPAPPARGAAGACSSSWLCPDVIQTWQQFDFKGGSTDLPDAGFGPGERAEPSRPRSPGPSAIAAPGAGAPAPGPDCRPSAARRAVARRLPRAPAPHRAQVAPPKFPREGPRDKKPLPKLVRTSGGPSPPSGRPERRPGPHRHMQLFVFCPAGRCLRAASGTWDCFSGGDT